MTALLRPMTEQEYLAFYEYSRSQHIKDLMNERGMTCDEARRETERELAELMPDGPTAPDNHVMAVEDGTDHRVVGYLWYIYEWYDDTRQVFVCDFGICEPERRKGYAAAALGEMEKRAGADGCEESVLFVDNDNEPAQRLYARCGYARLKDAAHGRYLKKKLGS